MPLAEWIRSYRTVESLDFDVLAPGHGALFGKSDVVDTRRYFEDLVEAVSAGMAAGIPLEELKTTIKLEQYRDWVNYERLLPDNIELSVTTPPGVTTVVFDAARPVLALFPGSRAQEIAGIASVVMTLRPTFSIDYIRVTMNLE